MKQQDSQLPQLKDLRKAADIVSEILLELARLTKPGVSLAYLDEIASRMMEERGATSANLNYEPKWAKTPYPATICSSVDYEVAHAPPAGRELNEGSIVTFDLGVKYKTAAGDAALTVPVGEINNRKERLLRYAERAMWKGVEQVKAGVSTYSIGEAIQEYSETMGYRVIDAFGGHAIGREMHEKPHIPMHRDKSYKDILKEGQVVCIEPTLTPGKGKVGIFPGDNWTAYCLDGQPAAMFEVMLRVEKDSYEVLTTHLLSGEQDS